MIQTNPIGFSTPTGPLSSDVAPESLGKEEFLNLLVTQLRYQDPLDPIRNEEFIAQLSQFSSVEQLQNINSKLEEGLQTDTLLSRLMNNAMAPILIGKNISSQSSTISLTGENNPLLTFQLDNNAQTVSVGIIDSRAGVVRTLNLGPASAGDLQIVWNGRDDNGTRLPAGEYTYSILAADAEGNPVTASSAVTGKVTAVRYKDGDVLVVLEEGQTVSLSAITEVSQE